MDKIGKYIKDYFYLSIAFVLVICSYWFIAFLKKNMSLTINTSKTTCRCVLSSVEFIPYETYHTI